MNVNRPYLEPSIYSAVVENAKMKRDAEKMVEARPTFTTHDNYTRTVRIPDIPITNDTHRVIASGGFGCVITPALPNIDEEGNPVAYAGDITKIFSRNDDWYPSMLASQKVYSITGDPYQKQFMYRRSYKMANLPPNIKRNCKLDGRSMENFVPIMHQKHLGISIHQLQDRPDILDKLRKLPIETIFNGIMQSATNVNDWMANGFIHGDIRETNVTINTNGEITIIDYDWFKPEVEFMYRYPMPFYSNPPESLLAGSPELGGSLDYKYDDDNYLINYINIFINGMDKVALGTNGKLYLDEINKLGLKSNEEKRLYFFGRMSMNFDSWGYLNTIIKLLYLLYGDVFNKRFTLSATGEVEDTPENRAHLNNIVKALPHTIEMSVSNLADINNIISMVTRILKSGVNLYLVKRTPFAIIYENLKLIEKYLLREISYIHNISSYNYTDPFKYVIGKSVTEALQICKIDELNHIIPLLNKIGEIEGINMNDYIRDIKADYEVYESSYTDWNVLNVDDILRKYGSYHRKNNAPNIFANNLYGGQITKKLTKKLTKKQQKTTRKQKTKRKKSSIIRDEKINKFCQKYDKKKSTKKHGKK